MKKLPAAISLAAALGIGVVGPLPATATARTPASTTEMAINSDCKADPAVVGGVDLGCLTDYLFVFADGRKDANWQASSNGYVGDVAVRGTVAKERTSGSFAYAGTIVTDDTTLGKWDRIVDNNHGQAGAELGQTARLDNLTADLDQAMAQIAGLPATAGFEDRSTKSLDGMDTRNGVNETIVINVTSDMKVSEPIDIAGDAGDVYVLRWDSDADPSNGLNGKVKFQSGGAIVPHGALGPHSFIHIAGDINASGGGDTPSASFPRGPRLDAGVGALIEGGQDFDGGGFFTGYWLTTGKPGSGKTSSLSSAVFVGGWYTTSTKFSLTSGTSGVHVPPPVVASQPSGSDPVGEDN